MPIFTLAALTVQTSPLDLVFTAAVCLSWNTLALHLPCLAFLLLWVSTEVLTQGKGC